MNNEIEIHKARWCNKCSASGRAVRVTYAGAQKISDTVTIVAFACEHGHRSGENMENSKAQALIVALRGNGRC